MTADIVLLCCSMGRGSRLEQRHDRCKAGTRYTLRCCCKTRSAHGHHWRTALSDTLLLLVKLPKHRYGWALSVWYPVHLLMLLLLLLLLLLFYQVVLGSKTITLVDKKIC